MKKKLCKNSVFWAFQALILLVAACPVLAGQAKWTVLVYMAGENNLTFSLAADLEEMKTVGSTGDVNIVVQADTGYARIPGLGDGQTHRLKINKGQVQDYPMGYNADMAAPQELSSFIDWAVSNFPADHYCLILWDHGLGWAGGQENSDMQGDKAPVRGIMEDAGSHSFMSLSELNLALSNAGVRFDLIEFDACLMGMWEVAVSVQDWASFLSFSQATEPATGNPYDMIFEDLNARPWMDGMELARIFVNDYLTYYQDDFFAEVSVTKSAIDTSRLWELSQGINNLAALLNVSFDQFFDKLLEIRVKNQEYPELPGSIDLMDFLEELEELDDDDLGSSVNNLMELLQEGVIVASGFKNAEFTSLLAGASDVSGSRGLSIFLPTGDQLLPGELDQYSAVQAVQQAPEWFAFVDKFAHETGLIPDEEAAPGGFILGTYWYTFSGLSGADLDLYVVEPDGGVFAPWTGRYTPNGLFSMDSRISGIQLEYYVANPVVKKGIYMPVVNYQPGFGVQWWQEATAYFYYIPDASSNEVYQSEPRHMSMLNPAPAEWDDYAIELLSRNYYSDWWIPASVERSLSRASLDTKRSFWTRIYTMKTQKRALEKHVFFQPLN